MYNVSNINKYTQLKKEKEKMKYGKRKLAVLITALLISLIIPFTALADGTVVEEGAQNVQYSGTGGGSDSPFAFLERNDDNSLAQIENKVKGTSGSVFRMLRYAAMGVGACCFVIGLIKCGIGGRSREEGKGQIFWALVMAVGAGCCIWALTTLYNIGAGM